MQLLMFKHCVCFFAPRRANSTLCGLCVDRSFAPDVSAQAAAFRHAKDVLYGAVCSMSVSAATILFAQT